VRIGAAVTRVTADAVWHCSERIGARTVIWAAEIRAAALTCRLRGASGEFHGRRRPVDAGL